MHLLAIQPSLFPLEVPHQELVVIEKKPRFFSPIMYLNREKWDNYLINLIAAGMICFGCIKATSRVLDQNMVIYNRQEVFRVNQYNEANHRRWKIRDFSGKTAFTRFYMKYIGSELVSCQDTLWICNN